MADLVIATPSLLVTAPMLAATMDGSRVAVAWVPPGGVTVSDLRGDLEAAEVQLPGHGGAGVLSQ
ncbi:hypothetical protein AWB94_00385 [Mycolicibacterium canariasense]|nr:hypothetical protein AWB94_00385 [Mycolicibacterium canariasense]